MPYSRRSFCKLLGAASSLTSINAKGIGPALFDSQVCENDGFLHLDRNENAYGPSPNVMHAILRSVRLAHRYTRSEWDCLSDAIARFHHVDREQVLLGAGSTDILRMAAQAFLGPHRALVVADPTFDAPEHYALSLGTPVIKVPLTPEFAHDLSAMRSRVTQTTGLVYVCNPNDPTGTLTRTQELEKFISSLPATTTVVVDEAYHEYAASASGAYTSFIAQAGRGSQLIVLRTFSKVYGLAGLRLGYAAGDPKVLASMRTFSTEDSINSIAAGAGLAAIDDQAAIRESVQRNDDDRQEFFNQAMGRALKPIDSHANFVFMDVRRPGDTVLRHFFQHRISLGPKFTSMPNHVRISLGTADEMTEFWRVWDLLPKIDMSM